MRSGGHRCERTINIIASMVARMPVPKFAWPLVDSFIDRSVERGVLASWWDDPTREPLAMIGRRRVGKSWLFRRFAHGKPAIILVAEQLPAQTQLDRFGDILDPMLGVRPSLPDVQTLFRVLFRLARDRKILVVIDEFPWLLGTSDPEVQRTLTAIQAVMEEERDETKLKLILCGSQVSQMEALFSEANPLHGRLRRFAVRPLSFADGRLFMNDLNPIEAFERFAITGGMPMYLDRLGEGSLRNAVTRVVLDRDAPLFNEGRVIVEQELREPRVYFAILEQLAGGAKPANEIGDRIRAETGVVSKYLTNLEELRLVSKYAPFGAAPSARSGRWRLDDEFLRFWFRFVFPFQDDIESGLVPGALFDAEIGGAIAAHVAPVFEAWCLQWMRTNGTADATRFGNWWGNAANELRRSGDRTSEEIDAVGSSRNRIVVVAEAKWTNRRLDTSILTDLEKYKIPALRESRIKVAARPQVVLFSRSGYSDGLHELALQAKHVTLIDVPVELRSASRELSPHGPGVGRQYPRAAGR